MGHASGRPGQFGCADRALLASWKFLIHIELAKAALKSADHRPVAGTDAAKAAKVLRDFIRTNWGEVDFEFSDTFRKRNYSFNFEPTFSAISSGA